MITILTQKVTKYHYTITDNVTTSDDITTSNDITTHSCNRIEDKAENHVFCVITNDRLHYFAAEDSDEMFRWIDLLSPQVIIIII